MAAAENGHTEVVQVLWEFGANVNQQEKVCLVCGVLLTVNNTYREGKVFIAILLHMMFFRLGLQHCILQQRMAT